MTRARILILVALVGCGETKAGPETRSGASNAPRLADAGARNRNRTDAGGASGEACHTDPSQRLICDASKTAGVTWGPAIAVRQGYGSPPSPEGGTIVSGAYQLVAETLYGSVPPNYTWPRPGDQVQRLLGVHCDIAEQQAQLMSANPRGGGGGWRNCHRLVPQSLTPLEAGHYYDSTTNLPLYPEFQDAVSYSAGPKSLRLIELFPYMGDDGILGSYESVEDYTLVTGNGVAAAVTDVTDAGRPAAPTERDPRCPATPPAMGDPCSPDPAPLECEYGGDTLRYCTTFAACALDIHSGKYSFQVDPPGDCAPSNPAPCPESFAAAQAVADTTLSPSPAPKDAGAYIDTWSYGVTCRYAEGVCGCQPMQTGLCSGPVTCTWRCRAGAAVLDEATSTLCPWPRPFAGDPCQPGLQCDYLRRCGDRTSLGPSMTCQNGYWSRDEDLGGCPSDAVCPAPMQ
jgi:hypothetical protein